MADEKVTIKIEVNSDVRGAKRVNRELKEIARTADRINAHSGMRSSTRNLTGMLNGQQVVWKKHFDELDKLTKGFGKGMQMGMKLATKAVVAELAILSVSLVGIHGLFAAGQGIMKAYRWALDATGAAATGLVFALSTVAAALREQQAAMYAYKTNTLPQFGSGLNQTRVLMRALTSDSEMAFIGVENLNKAFAAVSKNSTWTANSQQLLRGLMDFAAAGQPLEQGVEKAGELIGLLQDTKSSWGSIKKAAEASSPAMKKALEEAKKQGINTRQELINAINSGQLSSLGGVEGQFDAVGGTLINQLKGYFNIIRGRFADLGQQFLEPVKDAMVELSAIFSRMFVRTLPALFKRGTATYTDGIISIAEKFERMYTKVIYAYAERTEGVFEGISKWWANFRQGWEDTKEALRPFIEGARVIEDALKAAFQPIKETVSGKFGNFNEWLQDNRADVVEFGDKMGNLISAILKLFGEIGKLYRTILPFINRLVDGLTQVVNLTSSMFSMFSGMGQFGSLFAIMGMRQMGTKLGGWRGGYNSVLNNGQQQGRAPGGQGQLPYGPYGQNFYDDDMLPPGVIPDTEGEEWGPRERRPSRTGQWARRQLEKRSEGRMGQWVRGQLDKRGMLEDAGDAFEHPEGSPFAGLRSSTSDPFDDGSMDDVAPKKKGRAMRWLDKRANNWFERQERAALANMPDSPFDDAGAPAASTASGKKFSRFRNAGSRFMQYASDQFAPMTESEYKYLQDKAKQPSAVGRFGSRLRNARMRNPGLDKFQRSGGAQLGVGMGLGMLSSVAPAEMQGALALGGMAAQINPMLGLAVAGIGGALTSKSALGGGLAGAGGGAAIGMMVGGPAGAAIGAVLGGIGGAIMGWRNKSKEEAKKARKAVTETLTSITTGAVQQAIAQLAEGPGQGADPIREAFAKQNRVSAKLRESIISRLGAGAENEDVIREIYKNQLAFGVKISEEMLNDQLTKADITIDSYLQQTYDQMDAGDMVLSKFNERMQLLQEFTGKTEDQVLALAKEMGVNLVDGTKDYMEVLEELGVLQVKTAGQMRNIFTEGFTQATNVFTKRRERQEAQLAVDEQAQALAQKLRRGGGQKDIERYFEEAFPSFLALFETPEAAMSQLMTSFGGPGGTAFTDEKSPFFGMADKFAGVQPLLSQALGEYQNLAIPGMVGQINATLAERGMQLSDTGAVRNALISLQTNNPNAFLELTKSAGAGFGGDPLAALAPYITVTTKQLEESAAINKDELTAGVETMTEQMISQFEAIFKQYTDKPEWMTQDFINRMADPADTATPRGGGIGDTTSSRLAVTMNRHSVMDGMLTGKRNITSAWRNWNLGSMNSDHVMGRAYDLTGQNLGAYQQLVQNSGGFAEFHGANANRHLHVVPGPVGDTAVPAMTTPGPTMSAGGSTYNNYNFTVSSNSSDPEVVANVVMRKIEETQRDKRERK